MEKEELKKLLDTYDDLYYNQDISEISDEEYNIIKEKYLSLTGEDEYTYVPGEASKNSKKYIHSMSILSLGKVQISDKDRIKKEMNILGDIEDGVIIEPKFDGLTVVIYPNGVFATRGNGLIGEDITVACKQMECFKDFKTDSTLRAEIIMTISEFNRANIERVSNGLDPYKNTRNAAAGIIRNASFGKVKEEDQLKIKGLTAFIYDNLDGIGTHSEIMDELKTKHKDLITPMNYFTDYEEALNFIENYDRSLLDYEIDGLVMKSDYPNSLSHFGMTGHHPKNAIAIKFKSQGVWTRIKNIVWQVGRTGRITPVANFDKVQILGSDVSKATLHNMGIITALGLDKIYATGRENKLTEVFVIKANDVIPAIIQVKHPTPIDPFNSFEYKVVEPTTCPVCDGTIEKINNQIFCTNECCSSKIYGRLTHLAKLDAFNIEGLSEETAKKLVDMYMLKNPNIKNLHPGFIYDISLDDINTLEGFAKKSAEKLYKNIQSSKTISFDKFLYGCGMPLVGRKVSKDIAIHYSKTEVNPSIAMGSEYFEDKFKSLKEVDGIGTEIINSLINNFEEMVVPFGFYDLTYMPMKIIKKAVNQLSIVITGEFDISRKEITELITDKGHKVSGSVSKKTNYLLAAPGEEGTGKYKKATELNTLIINSIEELKELL